MSYRDWLHIIAFGGLIACLSAGVAQSQTKPALKDQPIPNTGQQQRAEDGEQAPAAKEQRGPDLLPAIKGIEAAIREHIAKEDKDESKRNEQREIADLQAQEDMALWAERMVWASVAGLILTVVGLVMLGGTLHYTRKAADYTRDAAKAARDSVEEARKATATAETTNAIVAQTAALELRAYLSVIPAGINELIGSQRAMGHVDIRNVGKIPARNVWVQVRMGVDDRDDRPLARKGPNPAFSVADDPKENDKAFAVDRAIHPETEMRQGALESDTISVSSLLSQQERHVYVWGVVYYDDGRQRRFTKFRHRYAVASRTHRTDWNKPARETREIITADKARFHPFGNSAN